jgi:fumarylacetoacetase
VITALRPHPCDSTSGDDAPRVRAVRDDPAMAATWVPGADGSGFGVDNLPYGVVRPRDGGEARPAVRVGDHALDLRALERAGALPEAAGAFEGRDLNAFLALGRRAWTATRERLTALLTDAGGPPIAGVLLDLADVEQLLPVAIGDYVDFYSSLEHATNVGRLFRPDGDPLTPNWRHLPIGYHGRAGTVAVSGTPVTRPSGQRAPAEPGEPPGFGPEPWLDVELELGFVTGDGPPHGTPIAAAGAAEHVFGFVLVNDWSARQVQRWEYQPLGPFLGKSFLTSVSAWIVPLAALEHRRVPGPAQEPPPMDYLRVEEPWALDVDLEVVLTPAGGQPTTVSRVNARRLYWNAAQQLAHATVNGAAVHAGDLFASGTISGDRPGTAGSLLELSAGGREPVSLTGGGTRTFLEDGDTVELRGRAGTVAFGDVRGTVHPARSA